MENTAQSRIMTSVGIGIGVSILSALSYYFYKRSQKEVIPTKWKKIGTLDQLYLIPIKSCAPIELDEAFCETLGVQKGDIKDRGLMVINTCGQVITAKTHPNMFKIVPKILSRSELIISAPGMEDLRFDYATMGNKPNCNAAALIGGFLVNVLECGDNYNKWFSQYLLQETQGLRLVYYPHQIAVRPIDRFYKEDMFIKQDPSTIQDMSSYHLINNASIDELNTRLRDGGKIPLLYFRANFYVKNGGPAFDEDYWQWVRIGNEAVFRNVNPRHRRNVPTVNPYTTKLHSDREPLETQKTNRLVPGYAFDLPVIGIQLGLRAQGSVRRGDGVYVQVNT